MDLGVKSEDGEGSSSGTRPDIYNLFSHYNSLYFDNALGGCIVYWSDSRTARAAGMCCYVERGRCEIRLSEPLLKFRSTADLKNTLLHEMIHAFLYVTLNMKDHGYHGPGFAVMVNAINSSSKADPQRPSGGYNITVSHDFSKGVNSYGVGQWICTSCGDMIEGPMNRKPSANHCIENMAHDNSCGNSSCHWHRHKTLCSGSYKRCTVKGRSKDKMRVPKDAQENKGDKSEGASYRPRQSKKRAQNVEQMAGLSNALKCDTHDDSFTSSGIKSLYCNDSQRNTPKKQRKATPLKVEGDTQASNIPRRPRTSWFAEGHKLASLEEENLPERKKEKTPVGQWFAFYGDEESDEDIKPLINKRTKRRQMEKLAKLKERGDTEAVGVACPLHHGERSVACTTIADTRKAHDAAPLADKIIYILDD